MPTQQKEINTGMPTQQFSIRSYQMKTKDKAGQRADRSIVNSKSKNLFHSLNLVKTN